MGLLAESRTALVFDGKPFPIAQPLTCKVPAVQGGQGAARPSEVRSRIRGTNFETFIRTLGGQAGGHRGHSAGLEHPGRGVRARDAGHEEHAGSAATRWRVRKNRSHPISQAPPRTVGNAPDDGVCREPGQTIYGARAPPRIKCEKGALGRCAVQDHSRTCQCSDAASASPQQQVGNRGCAGGQRLMSSAVDRRRYGKCQK